MNNTVSNKTPDIVYISGKISGINDWWQRFARAEEFLKVKYATQNKDVVIINPAKIVKALPEKFSYESRLSVTLALLDRANAIYMLENWRDNSKGAAAEYQKAIAMRYKILYEDGFLHEYAKFLHRNASLSSFEDTEHGLPDAGSQQPA